MRDFRLGNATWHFEHGISLTLLHIDLPCGDEKIEIQ